MKIQFWSVGKAHESYVKEGVDDFTKRIGNYFPVQWQIIAPPKQAATLSGPALKKAEAALILAQLEKRRLPHITGRKRQTIQFP